MRTSIVDLAQRAGLRPGSRERRRMPRRRDARPYWPVSRFPDTAAYCGSISAPSQRWCAATEAELRRRRHLCGLSLDPAHAPAARGGSGKKTWRLCADLRMRSRVPPGTLYVGDLSDLPQPRDRAQMTRRGPKAS